MPEILTCTRTMPAPIMLVHPAGRTRLKWHRGRARAADMEFAPDRILEGMRAGASVEIDLVRHAGGGFAVLHDAHLDRSTTGRGAVADCPAEVLRGLRRRDNAGKPTGVPVALLADLSAALAGQCGAGACLQLDLKAGAAELTSADVDAFAAAVAPLARAAILSGGDAAAVARLAAAVPGLATGHDPCLADAAAALARSGDDAGFVARALQEAGPAEMLYLDRRIVFAALGRGFDMVAACHAAGRQVDVWTFGGPADLAAVRAVLTLAPDQITTDDPAGLLQALSPA